jgi:hypothetical protein
MLLLLSFSHVLFFYSINPIPPGSNQAAAGDNMTWLDQHGVKEQSVKGEGVRSMYRVVIKENE